MAYSVPTPIYTAVSPYKGNVPDAIWEDVVYVESGFNPNAYNKAGAYGLFQLLYPGGQGEAAIAAGHSVNDLYNPSVNAQYGMPAIQNTWSGLGPSFDNSLGWWEKFAAESGHPGGTPGQAYTDQVALQLKDNYQGGGTVSQSNDPWTLFWNNLTANLLVPGSAFGNSSAPSAQANAKTGDSIAQAGSLLNGSSPNLSSIAMAVGVFIVAIVIIIIGFVVLTHE